MSDIKVMTEIPRLSLREQILNPLPGVQLGKEMGRRDEELVDCGLFRLSIRSDSGIKFSFLPVGFAKLDRHERASFRNLLSQAVITRN